MNINIQYITNYDNDILNFILYQLKNEINYKNEGFGFYNNKDIISKLMKLGNGIVMKNNDEIIGFLVYSEHDSFLYEIVIFEIFEKFRNQGLGKLLFNKLLQILKEKDIHTISLEIPKEGVSPENFWIKLGFINVIERKFFFNIIETCKIYKGSININYVEIFNNKNDNKLICKYNIEEKKPIIYPCDSDSWIIIDINGDKSQCKAKYINKLLKNSSYEYGLLKIFQFKKINNDTYLG